MGLQIWLPLDKTLKNQGLNPTQPTLVNSLDTGTGKVTSSCYKWSADGAAISLPGFMNTFKTYEKYSISAWVYYTGSATNHSSVICSSGDWNQAANQLCFGLYSYNNGYGHILCPNKKAWNDGLTLSSPLALNTWHHITITYDGTKTLVYVNGIYQGTYNGGGITATSNSANLYIGSATYYTGFTIKGNINDFRIYDHCLSTKEVKELAKGLILHYKLEGKNLSGSGNLLKNTSNPIDARDLVRTESVVFDEKICQNVFERSITATSENYIYSSRTAQVEKSTTYTFSCDMYVNDYVKSTEFFWLSDTEANKKTGTAYVNVTNLGITIEKRNEWFHVVKTFTTKADDYTGYVRIDNNGSSASGTPAVLRITNLKLEKGSIATPYTPHPEEMQNLNKELDYSGYENHATLVSTISQKNDSAIYSTSTNFSANTNQRLQSSNLQLTDSMTYSIWVNFNALTAGFIIDARKSDIGYQPLYYDPSSGIQIFSSANGGTSSYIPYTFTTGKWYHLVAVITASGSKLYINGELIGNAGAVGANLGNAMLTLGTRHTYTAPVNAAMSDLRVYATALSEESIKELYKTKMSVTELGSTITYEFNETSKNAFNITKNGIFNIHDISERGPILDMKTKVLNDGSSWARVFYHKNNAGTVLFSSVDQCRDIQDNNRYSRLYLLDQLKGADGKYEFMLTFPSYSATGMNRWKQTNNPCNEFVAQTSTGTGTATGYEAIQIDWNTNYWGGLTRQNENATINTSCYLSGSVGHSNWFFAIGANEAWNNAVPGPNSAPVEETELWVRIDTLPKNVKTSLYNNQHLQTSYIYEF